MPDRIKTYIITLIFLMAFSYSCSNEDVKPLYDCTGLINVTYDGTILAIFMARCQFSGCHPDNGNWFDYNTAKSKAATIKQKTLDDIMPLQPRPGGDLTQEELNKIACWVDSGAPEN